MVENNLTEQWKAGKLKFGEYFCKTESNDYPEKLIYERYMSKVGFYQEAHGFSATKNLVNDVVEVLAQVPSYEEWDKMRKDFLHLKKIASGLLEGIYNTFKPEEIFIQKQINQENKQFRQLLKECREYLSDVDTYCTKNADESYLLITRINAAIGESEE